MQKVLPPLLLTRSSSRWSNFDSVYSRSILFGILTISLVVAVASSYLLVHVSPLIAIASVVALPALLLCFVKPELGLMLVILVLPLEELNNGSVSAIKLISVVVFGCAVLSYLISRPVKPLVHSTQNGLIFLFVLIAITSAFVAIDPTRVIDRTLKLLRVLALYFFVINLIRSEKYLHLALWLFLIGGFLCTLYGFIEPVEVGERFEGALGQPNGYGLTMTPRIPIGLTLFLIEKKTWKRLLIILMLAFISYGIILSGSRGGLLAVSLALFLFVLFQRNKFTWLAVIGIIFTIGFFVMPKEIKARVGIIDEPSEIGNSTDRRLTYQIFGVDLFQQNPILGVGLDGFAESYAQSEYRFLIQTRELRVAHNTYLEIATGTGIVGLIPFIGILTIALFLAWKYSQSIYLKISPKLAMMSAGLFAALGGYYLGMLFGSRQYEKTFWFLLALPIVIQVLIHAKEKQAFAIEQNPKLLQNH
ncbi:MAG: O-antigen ligase family protein [Anaerolineales bacterium]|nr:O-antigen ligase family protein [Anaerolineales bacterium]